MPTAIATKAPDPPWMDVARRELGVREIAGPKHNARILEYQATCRLKATTDEVHWCSALANWVFLETNRLHKLEIKVTRSAAAMDWVKWGVELEAPIVGCLAIVPRKDPKNPRAAHVGFVVQFDARSVLLLAGNQGNAVSIRAFKRSPEHFYRWPANYPLPAA